ncbi:hypothetical protein [Streptomyces roseus]|uniref:Uncharacterized protein n=1 Tax=Streptomyces roseus TaxID=66430 RepID=A0A0J6XH45_9ACTN|nr:hypothetical protein [Streptomyces roseus]KMO93497.1 hypothetical protein ACS04_35040 [Streptomyces roseus]
MTAPYFVRRAPRREGPQRRRDSVQKSYVIKRRLLAAGMTGWQLADLLGVHEHQIDLEELPDLPVRVLLELARRLDMHPADLMPGSDDLFELPRQRRVADRRPVGADHDALTVLTALAYADDPLTADALAAALSWTRHRTDTALDHARTHPDTGGVLLLRHVPPEAYTVTPRLDILDAYQVDALTGRKKSNAAVRGPIQPTEAEVLLRVWVDGGIDPHDAAQRQALEDLAAAEMVNPGGIVDRFHDNVLYSLLGLPASSLPTDNNSAFPLT